MFYIGDVLMCFKTQWDYLSSINTNKTLLRHFLTNHNLEKKFSSSHVKWDFMVTRHTQYKSIQVSDHQDLQCNKRHIKVCTTVELPKVTVMKTEHFRGKLLNVHFYRAGESRVSAHSVIACLV